MKASLAVAACLFLPLTGCSTNVWIEDTQTFAIQAADLKNLNVETHNGDIHITGNPNATQIEAVVTAKYGGFDRKSAESCKDAIELVSESDPTGRHRLMPKWRRTRASDWQACINYKILMPARLASTLTTHNGDIVVKDVDGPCEVETHNGDVHMAAQSSSVKVITHNGDVHVACDARDLAVESHNGDIHVESPNANQVAGRISTHNGRIVMRLSDGASTELSCRTHNGRIRSELPWQVSEMSRYQVVGRLGQGGGRLEMESFNGDISLVK